MAEKDMLKYKGKPMQRRGNKIYYGSFEEPFVIELTIGGTDKVGDLEVANAVTIELKNSESGEIIKKAERETLYKAIDIAEFWLLDALGEV